jgi:hypothetical protein
MHQKKKIAPEMAEKIASVTGLYINLYSTNVFQEYSCYDVRKLLPLITI